MEGLGWRIENGLTVGVLDDKWIPMEDRVICPESNALSDNNLKVSTFINFFNNSWDEDSSESLF